MSDFTDSPVMENPAETMRKVMEDLEGYEVLFPAPAGEIFSIAQMITLPEKRRTEDLTGVMRNAAEYLKPARRKGTARCADLQSLTAWANRFKGDTSVLFANPSMTTPTITCIADYHAAGPVDIDTPQGDPTARHCHHRAVYSFPLSDEWQAWTAIAGKPLSKDNMGEFIEANAKDIMDPTPALLKLTEDAKNEPWENRLIGTARQIEGRYGQLRQLLAMSKQFQVYETSDLTVTSNRDTGETSIQFLNEHKGADGKPLSIPNLIIIAIPVFLNAAPYRMPVRFRYRKIGGEVKFIMTPYNPERAFQASFDEAVVKATEDTGLPMFQGSPEA